MKNKDRLQSKIIQAVSKPRIIKTGLSVFVTAWLCQLLNWPVIFAVIAAIVSIEPSVHASIQKGKVRLPAAAVGAFFAMLFNFVLGPTPLTYSLSAVLTIYVCHMLRWHHALIVATLTAVNMIETVHGHWFIDFLVRLGTTSIGIIVSTCINFLIFPPKFTNDIVDKSEMLNQNTKKLLNEVLDYQLYRKGSLAALRKSSQNNFKQIENAYNLIEFQKDEYRYHRYNKNDLKLIRKCDQQISDLEIINHHIADMTFFSTYETEWSSADLNKLEEVRATILSTFDSDKKAAEKMKKCISDLIAILHLYTKHSDEANQPVATVTYELLAICIIMRKMEVEYQSVRSSQSFS